MNNYENAIRSLKSLKKLDDYGMFQMTYYGDYKFDEFLKHGAKDQNELETVIEKLLFNDIDDIEAKINMLGGGCTVFSTRNTKGDVVYCRNYDFGVYSPPLQLITRPDNGYASVSTVSMLYLGYGMDKLPSGLNADSLDLLATPYIPADGFNEKGLAIALLSVSDAKPSFDENKITLNPTVAIRLVLDKAANVDEAIELLRQYNMFFSYDIYCHFLITDASGRSVLVEYWDNDLQVVESQIGSNFIAYNGVKLSQGNAEERYDKVKETTDDNNGILDKKQCIDLLMDVGARSTKVGLGLQWSAIYNLSTLEANIFANGNTDNIKKVVL